MLGFGFVKSDLDLQGATSLAEPLRDLNRSRVRVRAVPVVVERAAAGEAWRVDTARSSSCARSLAFGVRAARVDRP